MLEAEKPLSTDMVKVCMGRDIGFPILPGTLFAVTFLDIFEAPLIFILKTPEMFMEIHGYFSGSICSSSAN